jgi:hypothetical protein
MADSFLIKNQQAWFDDEGYDSGYFHTYNALVYILSHSSLSPDNPYRLRIWIDWECQHQGGFDNFFIESQAAQWGKEMIKLLQEDYQYRFNEDLYSYVDSFGGHDERAWGYRFGLILGKYYGFSS